MEYLLDNPIYNALQSNQKAYAEGNVEACFYKKDITNFAGLKEYNEQSFADLALISNNSMLHILFSPKLLEIPADWNCIKHIEMFQMVYLNNQLPNQKNEVIIKDLARENVTEMKDLVELTQPGPFLINTIELGNYTGIFEDGKLVAMAGHRFHLSPYVEISAVCTHPDHLGKGLAYEVIREQIRRIQLKNQIPFLHVRQDNNGAIKLYEKLGFTIRKAMYAEVITKA